MLEIGETFKGCAGRATKQNPTRKGRGSGGRRRRSRRKGVIDQEFRLIHRIIGEKGDGGGKIFITFSLLASSLLQNH